MDSYIVVSLLQATKVRIYYNKRLGQTHDKLKRFKMINVYEINSNTMVIVCFILFVFKQIIKNHHNYNFVDKITITKMESYTSI